MLEAHVVTATVNINTAVPYLFIGLVSFLLEIFAAVDAGRVFISLVDNRDSTNLAALLWVTHLLIRTRT